MNPRIDLIKDAIAKRQLKYALELCTKGLTEPPDGVEVTELTRLHAEVLVRLGNPIEAADLLLGLIERGTGQLEDYFLASLYLLEADQFEKALSVIEDGKNYDPSDQWFTDEFLFLKGYCFVKLGKPDDARKLAELLPDDIQMIVKPLQRPLTKADLL